MSDWFNARKAAQVVAFFAMKQSGQINVLKLAKLVYLADRRFMQKYDCTILNDRLVSMPYGPVNSMTLNHINGLTVNDQWEQFVADRAGHMVATASTSLSVSDLDELSKAEIDVLNETWSTFGSFDQFRLAEYTHQNCPEWEDPHGSARPIPYARVFKFLGKVDQAESLQEKVLSERAALANLAC